MQVLIYLCTLIFFLLFGDINIDVSVPSTLLNNFCNVVNPHNLSLIHTGHTRVTDTTATTIDTMLSSGSEPDLVTVCQIIPPLDSSDHNDILSGVSLKTAQYLPQHPRKIWRYDHADFDLANDLLSQIDVSSIIVEGDINVSWANWERSFIDIMERYITQRTLPRRKNLQWL